MNTITFINYEACKEHFANRTIIQIDSNLYDVTDFDDHPGGTDVFTDNVNTDVTTAFNDVGHSDEAKSMLESYIVGTIVIKNAAIEKSLLREAPMMKKPELGESPSISNTNKGLRNGKMLKVFITLVAVIIFAITCEVLIRGGV
jgi:cytochrome b involved in lipid metabolism